MNKICALFTGAIFLMSLFPQPSHGADSQSVDIAAVLAGVLVGASIGGLIGLAIHKSQRERADNSIKEEIEQEKQKLEDEKHSLTFSILYAEGGIGPVLTFRF